MNRWPHRLAVLLCCATFPLIWVGGLVTTYDAGMAVPDWPGTYGYNLLLYPWQTWLFGPWDLFIEHGHRLLGALVGMLSIALVVAVFRWDPRRWMRWTALLGLLLVIGQGGLGGLRVLLDQRLLANVHGCVGPLFFAFTVFAAVVTSSWWWRAAPLTRPGSARVRSIAILTAALAYIQLVLGAQLRHVPFDLSPSSFRMLVFFHLLMAAVLTAHVILLTAQILLVDAPSTLWCPALLLSLLVLLQLGLGSATWVVNYAWPWPLGESLTSGGYTIQSKGFLQSHIVTAHVATGSLIIAVAVQIALRSIRLLRIPTTIAGGATIMVGATA